ncbi:MAG TPA: hypothetical protein DCF91_04565 [Porphyromonadaceae bacterium]|nr:hypothetical protein [Porphyromonadaceae bacterium]
MREDIPNSIKHYLSEIADRLWSGHASIMVGAGFSKNAQKANYSTKSFPTWNELGDIFYEKLYAQKPNATDRAYLNVLKLADEVEVGFGKEYLNNLIKRELPDNEYIPSELHVKLLSLPWKDVFTTNYDTLLERSTESIVERRYEVVTNMHDLVWSTSPRIVKLHGSFPSERPFIISGEDYRQYPKKYAPFVNTVQQSLLENTLCLIGFSGDDPNFLNWIGWIRDNLGKENSPKIYLIGILSLSKGQIRLLEERNIIPIDLSNFCSENIDHYKALDQFVNSLKTLNTYNVGSWGDDNYSEKYQTNNYLDLLEKWRKQRCTYPGWLILPANKRNRLNIAIEDISLTTDFLEKLSMPNDLFFLFEFNWRLEKGLQPMRNDWFDIYVSIVNKYNPYCETLQIEGAITRLTNNDLDWSQIQEAWIDIQISIIRLCREEGWSEKWGCFVNRLDELILFLSAEQQARFQYEKCLFFAYNFEIAKLKDAISNWVVDMTMPYWEAKRATLIAEFKSTADAVKILESALGVVRSRLNLSPIINDYSLVSIEAYIMLLYQYVVRANDLNINHSLPTYNNNYQERWQVLKQYDCDPNTELKDFRLQMQSVLVAPKSVEKKLSFDIGWSTTNYKSANNKTYRLAWEYFRFIEEVGLPYHLPYLTTLDKDCFNNALPTIAGSSSFSANVAMIRSGDNNAINTIYNRLSLSNLTKEDVTVHIYQYTRLLEQAYKTHCAKGEVDNIITSLSETLPEVISRLCCKASFESRIEVLRILKDIYSSDVISAFQHIVVLMKRLVNSFSTEEQYFLIPRFLEFPLVFNRVEKNKYDPFYYIDVVADLKGVEVDKSVIDELISNLLSSDFKRQLAYNRLYILFKCNLLKARQISRMMTNAWKVKDKYGFPANLDYYYYVYLGLPHPSNIEPSIFLHDYLTKAPFPINGKDGDMYVFGQDMSLLYNIRGTYQYKDHYRWTQQEINNLVINIVGLWDSDKKYQLSNDVPFGFSRSNDFNHKIALINAIITTVISEYYSEISQENILLLETMVNEYPDYGVCNLELKAALPLLYDDFQELESSIILAISSPIEKVILDGVQAIIELIKRGYDISYLVDNLTSNFRCGKKEGLEYNIDCITEILSCKSLLLSSFSSQNIELGLLYLISYAQITCDDTENEANKKTDLLVKIAKLVLAYKRQIGISDACTKWEQIIFDNNQFVEVLNAYK